MIDWSKLPDLAAFALLTLAFFSVARFGRTSSSSVWLAGWLTIVLHFAIFLFVEAPGTVGAVSAILGTSALVWAGILFMWAAVPYRDHASSRWMVAALFLGNTFYIVAASLASAGSRLLQLAAVLIGALPLAVALGSARRLHHPLRWALSVLYCLLSVVLLTVQNRSALGQNLAINAVLFTVYFGCCLHFLYVYRRATTGALITVLGFFAWANVFTVAPLMDIFWPSVHLENEVWNLPKYVVALGMILILLEDQIEHNKFLALHDELTGLPNRRLFEDRLTSALERARRTAAQTALLVIDLDRFKQVNDSHGHHVGDELLKHVGELFVKKLRRTDTVARTGGDEFSVVLEEPVSRADALRVARILTEPLEAPIQLGAHVVHIGASVGIALFPEDASDAETLCIAADLRMYANKREARCHEESNTAHRPLVVPFQAAETATGLQ